MIQYIPTQPQWPGMELPGQGVPSTGGRAVHDLLHRKSGWLNETKGGSRWDKIMGLEIISTTWVSMEVIVISY